MKRSVRTGTRFAALVPGLLALTSPGPTALAAGAHAAAKGPLAHTYSIVARDPVTGEMGVAVQSHYFSVGPVVPWAEAGVGAVATQSLVLVDYGPEGLDLMRKGVSAPAALKQLLAKDKAKGGRQVAMIDAKGNVDAWTGPDCIPAGGQPRREELLLPGESHVEREDLAGHGRGVRGREGRSRGADDAGARSRREGRRRHPRAAVGRDGDREGEVEREAVERSRDRSARRGLARSARRAAQADQAAPRLQLRGRRRRRDLGEEARRGAEALRTGDEARARRGRARVLAAVSMYTNDRVPEALQHFHRVFQREHRWVDLVPRLARVGLFPNDPAKIAEVQRQAPSGVPR